MNSSNFGEFYKWGRHKSYIDLSVINGTITPQDAQPLLGKRVAYDKANRLMNRLLKSGRSHINRPKVREYKKAILSGAWSSKSRE